LSQRKKERVLLLLPFQQLKVGEKKGPKPYGKVIDLPQFTQKFDSLIP
jgi:hypothetical protein